MANDTWYFIKSMGFKDIKKARAYGMYLMEVNGMRLGQHIEIFKGKQYPTGNGTYREVGNRTLVGYVIVGVDMKHIVHGMYQTRVEWLTDKGKAWINLDGSITKLKPLDRSEKAYYHF